MSLTSRIARMEVLVRAPREPSLYGAYGSRDAVLAACREAMARGDEAFAWPLGGGIYDKSMPPHLWLVDELDAEEFLAACDRYDRLWPRERMTAIDPVQKFYRPGPWPSGEGDDDE